MNPSTVQAPPDIQPVNPLTGELTTITVARRKDETAQVQGRIVKPGLAITPVDPEKARPGRPRFSLTHIPTGLACTTVVGMCGVHVQEVAAIAAGYPVDWTSGKDEVIAAIQATDLLEKTVRRCGSSYCEGDGPEPPSYGVRCHTCDWEWEDEYDEGPLDREQARRMAGDHECDPEVEIESPITGKWHAEWQLTSAETAVGEQPPATASPDEAGAR